MELHRRKFLRLAAGVAALPGTPRLALALDYPSRPVHVIDGFTAGGGPSIVARLISERLSQRLGQQFVVEDRPGANSSIAAEYVANAPADGYTLLMATAANTINTTLYPNLKFDFARDFEPVAISRKLSAVWRMARYSGKYRPACRISQKACSHSAPHVDRRNDEEGCRVARIGDHGLPATRREKSSLPGRWRW